MKDLIDRLFRQGRMSRRDTEGDKQLIKKLWKVNLFYIC